jgi:hypothetical protein
VKLALNQRYFAGQDVTIDEIEEIQPDEQQQRPKGGVDARAESLG